MMGYSIKEVAEITGLSINTLRYYDKEGLLPNLKRKESGYRVFYDIDLEIIRMIQVFKKSGMQIKEIKRFMYLFIEGESTMNVRHQMLLEQRGNLERKRNEIDQAIEELDRILVLSEQAMTTDSEKELRKRARKMEEEKNRDQSD